MKPTDEQLHILDIVTKTDENLQIKALAGTGKTSTIRLIDKAFHGEKEILYLVFNKRNQLEAMEPDENGSPKFHESTVIKTFNSLGHGVWFKGYGPLVVANGADGKPDKTLTQFKDLIKRKKYSQSEASEAWDEWATIRQAVAMAKAMGYIPEGKFTNGRHICDWESLTKVLDEPPSEFAKELIDELLFTSIQTAFRGFIDFNDQVFMPALFGGSFPRVPLVMPDEEQDLNACNQVMLTRLGAARIVSVGDPWQSIYQFRGAVQSGMEHLKAKFNMSGADLSISFRCPEQIVKNVHWHVPHMRWANSGGIVREFDQQTETIKDNSAIVCRNNAPLFRLALKLLAEKRSVRLHGTEIGPKVVNMMKKLGPDNMDHESMLSAIEDWEDERVKKGSKTCHDVADCMRVFASYGETLKGALAYAKHLFAQEGTIELLTGHKSKGLEWDRVYHLDPDLIRDGEQELNLRYVISTRAKQELITMKSEDTA